MWTMAVSWILHDIARDGGGTQNTTAIDHLQWAESEYEHK